jgi:hypothetical protein
MTVISSGFWPEDIKPSIQVPLSVLQPRADELTSLTKGLLVGKVSSTSDKDGTWQFHSLDVVVPTLKNHRQRLLTVKHETMMVYPAYVDAAVFAPSLEEQLGAGINLLSPRKKSRNQASSDDELIQLLKQALHSDQIKAMLVSLIALANNAIAEGHVGNGHASSGEPKNLGGETSGK